MEDVVKFMLIVNIAFNLGFMCCQSLVIRAVGENINQLTDQTINQQIPFKFLKLQRESIIYNKLIILHETIIIVHNLFYYIFTLPNLY